MKVKIEWQDEPELFEQVADALESFVVGAEDEESAFAAEARDEEGPYRERGTIVITTPDGRKFSLELHRLS